MRYAKRPFLILATVREEFLDEIKRACELATFQMAPGVTDHTWEAEDIPSLTK